MIATSASSWAYLILLLLIYLGGTQQKRDGKSGKRAPVERIIFLMEIPSLPPSLPSLMELSVPGAGVRTRRYHWRAAPPPPHPRGDPPRSTTTAATTAAAAAAAAGAGSAAGEGPSAHRHRHCNSSSIRLAIGPARRTAGTSPGSSGRGPCMYI